ncbi:MAG TPA: ATP phosphoribosyltransferase regulatory subunit, partial [Nitrososphaera sp.]|nr:ATP phosphoribosyltransferase regulatory subunit [Nitrososphaera sp.]
MRDLEPEELEGIFFVRDKFFETARIFNFQFMEPTPLEMLATMEAKSGSAISGETYSFTDKGERKVALRFDLTIGLSRFVAGRRDLRLPVKLASFAGVWRYDEPQAGRYRYFHQWDVEIFGPFSIESDAEVVEFIALFFRNLGLSVRIHINDRRLMEEFIRLKLGVKADSDVSEMFRAIDKVSKKGPDAILEEYGKKVDPSSLKALIELSNFKGSAEEIEGKAKQVAELPSWKTMVETMSSLRVRRVNNAIIDLGIVRGLDYYSGTVFEVFLDSGSSSSGGALVGGGRYDVLTAAFGRKDIGATGAAGGVERIVMALQKNNLLPKRRSKLVYVASAVQDGAEQVQRAVSVLRGAQISADFDMSKRALRKQLEDAAAKGAAFSVILPGKDEAATFTLRMMSSG